MKRLVAVGAVLVAFAAAPPVHASTPVPWCGAPDSTDRVPDATPGFAVHLVYARSDAPDRLAMWAPRFVGDVTAIDAWWRREDPTRALRFDLFSLGCATTFGQLDISSVLLSQPIGDLPFAFSALRDLLAGEGFMQPEKIYLVFYDGPVGQPFPDGEICGAGDSAAAGLPGIAVVFLSACEAESSDVYRPVVAIHELVHALGAVAGAAPHHCDEGHVCDDPADLLTSSLTGEPLEAHVLDRAHDDYYGHSGAWPDVRDSRFIERLDSPDRAAPSTPTAFTATDGAAPGIVRLSWRAASDDVGPIVYRVYQDGRFVASTSSTSTLLGIAETDTSSYSVRAADAVGHLSQPSTLRYRLGLGMVDAQGRLVRDTVRPPAVRGVVVRKTARNVVLSWPAVRDGGGVRNYRVTIVGARTFTVTQPRVTLVRAGLRGAVSLAAIDRGGNVGPTTVVPLRRLR